MQAEIKIDSTEKVLKGEFVAERNDKKWSHSHFALMRNKNKLANSACAYVSENKTYQHKVIFTLCVFVRKENTLQKYLPEQYFLGSTRKPLATQHYGCHCASLRLGGRLQSISTFC